MGMDIKKIFEAASSMVTETKVVSENMSDEMLSDLGVNLNNTEHDLVEIGEEAKSVYGSDPNEETVLEYAKSTGQTSEVDEIMETLAALMERIRSDSNLVSNIVRAIKSSTHGGATPISSKPIVIDKNDDAIVYTTTNKDLNGSLSTYNKKRTIMNLPSREEALSRASEEITALLNSMKSTMLANSRLNAQIINTVFANLSLEYMNYINGLSEDEILKSGSADKLPLPYGIKLSLGSSKNTFTITISQVEVANKVKEAYIQLEGQLNDEEEQSKLNQSLNQYYMGIATEEQNSLEAALLTAKNAIMNKLEDMRTSMLNSGLDRNTVNYAINNTKNSYSLLLNAAATSRSYANLTKSGIQINEVTKKIEQGDDYEKVDLPEVRAGLKGYIALIDVGIIANAVKSAYNGDNRYKEKV